jgi:hypothetical protein
MINTRDFLLFVVAVLFLLVSITATWAHRPASFVADSMLQANVTSGTEYSVEEEVVTVRDRQSTVDRIREKIVASTFLEEASPSVVVSEEVEEDDTTTSTDTESDLASVAPVYCSEVNSGVATLQSWPRENMSWVVSGSVRQLMVVAEDGTSFPRVNIPLYPVAYAEPTCLDSEIIGVTVGGALIFNGDAIVHANTSSDTLIGYARDGFPIYGLSSNESTDQCGGYQAYDGYRYTVDPNRSFMIGCFKAYPQSL